MATQYRDSSTVYVWVTISVASLQVFELRRARRVSSIQERVRLDIQEVYNYVHCELCVFEGSSGASSGNRTTVIMTGKEGLSLHA
jgi:hypothetical protein